MLARPKGNVVSEELHDQSAVLVVLFVHVVDVGNSVVEDAIGHFNCTFVLV